MRNLKTNAALLALAATALFYAMAFDWAHAFTSGRLIEASSSYAISLAIASLPYFVLHSLLKQTVGFPRLQWSIAVLVIALPLVLFPLYRSGNEPTNGWDYLLVPVWQLLLVGLLQMVVNAVTDSEQNKSQGVH
jgi:hypothetical protein